MTGEEIDAIIQQILLKKLKPFDMPKNINAQCIETGNTALTFAAIVGDVSLVKRMLAHGADTTLRNLDGANAFRLAIYSNHEKVVQILLPFETRESLNYVDCRGDTALSLAASLELATVESSIMARGGIIPHFKMKGLKTPSQIRRGFLDSLQQKGPLLLDNSSIPKAMLANCFVENKGADFPIHYLEYLSLNPDLRRLMVLVTEASGANQSKKFFFEQRHNTDLLFSDSTDSQENPSGCFDYKTKNIFCFYNGAISIETISCFFHEAMHLAMNFVYENDTDPYQKDDSNKKEMLSKILWETKAKLNFMRPEKMSRLDKLAYYSFCSVYTAYPENKRAMELIVKIPEILVRIGIKNGMAWLEQFKALMAYYRNVVIPDIQAKCKNVVYEEKKISLTPFEIVMEAIYEHNFYFFTDTENVKICKHLTADEWKKIKEKTLFFQDDLELIDTLEAKCLEELRTNKERKRDIHLEWAAKRSTLSIYELEQMTQELEERGGDPSLVASFKRYLENREILAETLLDPNNDEHLGYWSSQVTWFGGCDYKGWRIPHTIAKIFEMLQKKSLIDTPPHALLAEIHQIRKQDSGSWMCFFGITRMRSAAVEQLRTTQDEDFSWPSSRALSPGDSYYGL